MRGINHYLFINLFNMQSINIYLTFNGNCEAAFDFYRSVFGGEFSHVSRFSEMPPVEGKSMSEEEGNRIMHMSLTVSSGIVLMGSDTGGEWAPSFKQGNNFSMSINAESEEEADRIYAALSAGGMQTMPMSMTFWESYFGMLTDQFGINWMISYDQPR